MNVQDLKNSMTQRFGRLGLHVQKYSPEILLGAGLIGIGVTIFMVAKAAQKHNETAEIAEELFADIEDQHAYELEQSGTEVSAIEHNKDFALAYVKTGLAYAELYGPAAALGLLSVMAILASHGVMARRQVAIVAAYNLLNQGYQNYRARVIEELGADKDRAFYLGLREEQYTGEVEYDEEGKSKKRVKKTRMIADPALEKGSIYSVIFDESTNQYRRGDRLLNRAFLEGQQRYLNDLLMLRGHVFLNEMYERLGFPHTTEGAVVGWLLRSTPDQLKEEGRDGYISFGLEDEVLNGDSMRLQNDGFFIDPNVDGIIHTLI